jgi:sugar transferase (PEP-CTERM/EpsH1 system associated)
MANLLFLAHRLPYPPNKGDKVRSYHLLHHLSRQHRIFLGTFVDDPDDLRHLPTVRGMCTELHVVGLNPRMARLRSLTGLLNAEALTLSYYRNAGLASWVERICRDQAIDGAVVFSSAMAQYCDAVSGAATVVDFVDVDSAKWSQYADRHTWPMSWLYRREGRKLLEFERKVASRVASSFFVTDNEADLFRGMAPESAGRVGVMCNGVDAEFFAPVHEFESPFAAAEVPIVFTGAMDYWPNVDAVCWFATEVLPALRLNWPSVRFHVVGRSPAPAVQALAGDHVAVSGTVPDVRPYLRHAAVVVAPLRVARGIQNKILEAMAMGRPVVASESCAAAVNARPGAELLIARDAASFVEEVGTLLSDRARASAIGAAGRAAVLARYSWEAHLSVIDRLPGGTARWSPSPEAKRE